MGHKDLGNYIFGVTFAPSSTGPLFMDDKKILTESQINERPVEEGGEDFEFGGSDHDERYDVASVAANATINKKKRRKKSAKTKAQNNTRHKQKKTSELVILYNN